MPNASKAIVDQFTGDPVTFMESNIVLCFFGGPGAATMGGHTGAGSSPPKLVEARRDFVMEILGPPYYVASQLGKTLPVYRLNAVQSATGDSFNAYVCSYGQHATFGVTLGNAADLMVTAQMDGCSLGVGSAAPDGSRLVYHSNVGGDSAQQAAALASALPGGKKWEKTDYQTEKLNGYSGFSQYLKSTAIGVRKADTWTFWAQVYEWVKAGTHDETVTLGADAGAFAGLTKTVTKEVTKIYLRDVRKIA